MAAYLTRLCPLTSDRCTAGAAELAASTLLAVVDGLAARGTARLQARAASQISPSADVLMATLRALGQTHITHSSFLSLVFLLRLSMFTPLWSGHDLLSTTTTTVSGQLKLSGFQSVDE